MFAGTNLRSINCFVPFVVERQSTAQTVVSSPVNSIACSLTKLYMPIGFWPVSWNRSSVMRS